ncbi:cytochrome P450 6A1 [Rhypophila sp. PSN 637]
MAAMEGLNLKSLNPIRLLTSHDEWPTTVWVLCLTTLIGFLVKLFWRPAFPKNAPKLWKPKDWPIVGALAFFTDRRNFLTHGSRTQKTGAFSFYLGKYQVVNISGREGRKAFFDSRELSMSEGYATLYAASPAVPDTEKNTENAYDKWFSRTITAMMKKENFVKNLYPMVHDTQKALDRAFYRAQQQGGMIDPFDDIYRIVYMLTVRMVGPTEFVERPEMLDKTMHYFESYESALSATRVVFPWMLTWNWAKQMYYGAKLFNTLDSVVKERKKTGRRPDDALQFLLDGGDGLVRILTFIMGSLFAGQLNSGINAGWLMMYLATTPEWYKKTQEEVDGVVKRHRTSPDQSPTDILAALSVDDWESEFPIIDLGLRESIRLQLVGAACRKNVSGRDVPIGNTGEVVPKDGFATYLCDDLHMNPEIYPNPERWDPGRYLPDRAEDKKEPHAYMGWGLGRHPCLGMRFAKLEMAVIAACFITKFDYTLHTPDGKPLAEPYPSNRNRFSAHKPERPMRLKITPRKY